MKFKLTLASLAAATILLPAAHAQMSGTSHPEKLDDNITTSPDASAASHYVKPSPAIQVTAPVAATDTLQSTGASPAAECMSAPVPQGRRPLSAANDPDANIVMSAPDVPGQVNEGTPLYAELQTPLSTTESRLGDTFLAALTQPVTQHGEVLLPIGSQIRGRISEIHGGRRISGRASIRLRPESVTLPDGTTHPLYAEVTGLGQFSSSHVNSEGTIIGDSHPKAALTAVAAATGGAAVAGAALGGGVGAAVGAGVGASLGTIWWLKRDVQQKLPSGTRLIFSLDQPLNVSPTAQTAELAH